jgi:hypothetical protein
LKNKREHICVFEHQTVLLNQKFEDGTIFDKLKLDAFVRFFGKGVPYYSLIRNGIQFNEYVGAIQVGNTLISVLPKADKRQNEDEAEKNKWNKVLVDMLRVVHGFNVKAPSSSQLKIKNNSVLDLYFELFIIETEYLLHRGLVKKYRKTEIFNEEVSEIYLPIFSPANFEIPYIVVGIGISFSFIMLFMLLILLISVLTRSILLTSFPSTVSSNAFGFISIIVDSFNLSFSTSMYINIK